MKTQFKDVAPLYIGAEVIISKVYSSAPPMYMEGNTTIFNGVHLHFMLQGAFDMKPFLHRLYDMTEEQAELAGIWNLRVSRLQRPELWKGEKFTAETFLVLLKLGFDLFGLIDSEQAVDRKTLIERT